MTLTNQSTTPSQTESVDTDMTRTKNWSKAWRTCGAWLYKTWSREDKDMDDLLLKQIRECAPVIPHPEASVIRHFFEVIASLILAAQAQSFLKP